MKLRGLFIILVFVSALGSVISRHEARKIFTELRALEYRYDELVEEWGRLQLEQSTWAEDARIERMAGTELQLYYPNKQDIILLRR